MFKWLFVILCLINLHQATKTFKIEGRLIPSEDFPASILRNKNLVLETFTSATQALLNGGIIRARIQNNGKFILFEVPEGNHTVSFSSNVYQFPLLRVNVGQKDSKKVVVFPLREGAVLDAIGEEVDYPIRVSPVRKFDYFMKREEFNIISLFSNPMLLMSLVSLVLVFFGPKLIGSLDEETLKEVQENHDSLTGGFNLDKYQNAPSLSERLAKFT
ncbi:hypothetical protein K502DRAFT_341323 [Neoconidiobolus thromboides FSU 785]|nr:hypothetical protein K502DRAFT_341323 [Neoconidiobolus thromboides FSU 785]